MSRSGWIALGIIVGLAAAAGLVLGLVKLVELIKAQIRVQKRRAERLREQEARARAEEQRPAITPAMIAAWADTESWREVELDPKQGIVLRVSPAQRLVEQGVEGVRLDGAVLQHGRIVRVGELFPLFGEEDARRAGSKLELALRGAARAVLVRAEDAPVGAEWLRLFFFPVVAEDVGGPTRGSYRAWPPLRFSILASHLERAVEQADAAQLGLRIEHALKQWLRDLMVRPRE